MDFTAIFGGAYLTSIGQEAPLWMGVAALGMVMTLLITIAIIKITNL